MIALWRAAKLSGDPKACLEDLTARYSEPQRHYHTLHHIHECLNEFAPVRSNALNPIAVEFAIWFHDAVYDPQRTDNEERSADLAIKYLKGPDAGLSAIVSDLILTTKHHAPAGNPDAELLTDIDLSILGKPSERFTEYESEIRKEYSWVPPQVYAEKRAAVLQNFCRRPKIYSTKHFYDRYEERARNNLTQSISRLAHSAG